MCYLGRLISVHVHVHVLPTYHFLASNANLRSLHNKSTVDIFRVCVIYRLKWTVQMRLMKAS